MKKLVITVNDLGMWSVQWEVYAAPDTETLIGNMLYAGTVHVGQYPNILDAVAKFKDTINQDSIQTV